jgi:hypothetical protein
MDLKALVEAVAQATKDDESFFLEWKSTLVLNTKPAAYHVARCILGMANRQPDFAATAMGGLGYMVVGATAGEVTGITPVDLVDLDSKLRPYLGDRQPQWTPMYLTVEDVQVLVIVVEAPNWGDPIWTLRKEAPPEYRNLPAGTIFHRNKANTAPANPEQVEMLGERLLRRVPEELQLQLTVTPEVDEDRPLLRLNASPQELREWETARLTALSSRSGDPEFQREAAAHAKDAADVGHRCRIPPACTSQSEPHVGDAAQRHDEDASRRRGAGPGGTTRNRGLRHELARRRG